MTWLKRGNIMYWFEGEKSRCGECPERAGKKPQKEKHLYAASKLVERRTLGMMAEA